MNEHCEKIIELTLSKDNCYSLFIQLLFFFLFVQLRYSHFVNEKSPKRNDSLRD